MPLKQLFFNCASILEKNLFRKKSLGLSFFGIQQIRFFDLQEYQSKKLMSENGITVQRFRVVESLTDFKNLLKDFNCIEYVIKAQVLAGGRGKGSFKQSGMKGGVKLTKDKEKISEIVGNMLNDYLVTNQTTSDGVLVRKVMVAEALDIKKEFYLAILLDRLVDGPIVIASAKGGVDIEEVAHTDPEAIHKFVVPFKNSEIDHGLCEEIARKGLKLKDKDIIKKASKEIKNLYKLMFKIDATQIEINPFGLATNNQIVCFDAKIQFDENAKFRQKWIDIWEKENEEKEDERNKLAKEYNLNFIPMDGNIGCFVNGAGLAMATMDIIHHYGGSPANFLDVGGSVTQSGVENAFKILSQDKTVKAILVNIFGGIVNCEVIAKGLIAAKHLVHAPLIVRLEGTHQKSAQKLLESVPDIITASDLDDAAQKAVKQAKKA